MRALIAKEWWENRWLIRIFLVLAPLVSFGIKAGINGWEKTTAEQSIKYFLPISTLLFMLAIAADLISSDASSGRIGFILALPIRASQVWAAKATFLMVSSALYFIYLVLVESTMLLIGAAGHLDLFRPEVLRLWFIMGPVFATGAATLAFSALVDRGLPAAILAILTVGGMGFALAQLKELGAVINPQDPPFYALCALIGVAFLVASLTAMTAGRIHLRARLRRVALTTAAFFIVIVPPTAFAGADLYQWLHPEPDEEDIVIYGLVDVDPAGEWAVIRIGRGMDSPIWKPQQFPEQTWAISNRTGLVRDLTGLGSIRGIETWSEGPGRLVLQLTQPKEDGKGWTSLRRIYDLTEGKIVSTRPHLFGVLDPNRSHRRGAVIVESTEKQGQFRIHSEGRKPVELSLHRTATRTTSSWGIILAPPGRKTLLLFLDSGEARPLDADPELLPTAPEGHGFALDTLRYNSSREVRMRWRRVPLDGSPATTVLDGRGRVCVINRQRTRAVAIINDRVWWIDADRAEPVQIPTIRCRTKRPRFCWSTDGRVCVLWSESQAYRIEAMSSGPRVESIAPPTTGDDLHPCYTWYDGERWIRITNDRRRLEFEDADGSTRQLLPAPERRD